MTHFLIEAGWPQSRLSAREDNSHVYVCALIFYYLFVTFLVQIVTVSTCCGYSNEARMFNFILPPIVYIRVQIIQEHSHDDSSIQYENGFVRSFFIFYVCHL